MKKASDQTVCIRWFMLKTKKQTSASVWKNTHQIIKSDHLKNEEKLDIGDRGDVKGNFTVFTVYLNL